MLPQSSTRHPSRVSAGRSARPARTSEPGATLGGRLAVARPGSAWSGSRMTSPSSPSMMAIRQCRARSRNAAEPDDGGDLQRAGDDRRMAGAAAGLGGEAQDALRVEARRLARGQVVRQHDASAPPGRPGTTAGGSPIRWPRIRGLDVADVGGAGGQVRVGEPLEPGGVAVEHLADGVLGARSGRARSELRASRRRVGSAIIRRGPPGCRHTGARAGRGPRPRRGSASARAASRPRSSRSSSAATASAAIERWRQPLAARVEDHDRADRDTRADGDPAQGLHRSRGRLSSGSVAGWPHARIPSKAAS